MTSRTTTVMKLQQHRKFRVASTSVCEARQPLAINGHDWAAKSFNRNYIQKKGLHIPRRGTQAGTANRFTIFAGPLCSQSSMGFVVQRASMPRCTECRG